MRTATWRDWRPRASVLSRSFAEALSAARAVRPGREVGGKAPATGSILDNPRFSHDWRAGDMKKISPRFCIVTPLALALFTSTARGQERLDDSLEQATKSAVAKVAPCLVQIQTVGGLDVLGGGRGPQILRGQGPTTGVI